MTARTIHVGAAIGTLLAAALGAAAGTLPAGAQSGNSIAIPFRVQNRLLEACPAEITGNGDPSAGTGPIHWDGNVTEGTCSTPGDDHGYLVSAFVVYKLFDSSLPNCFVNAGGTIHTDGSFTNYPPTLSGDCGNLAGPITSSVPLLDDTTAAHAVFCPSQQAIGDTRRYYDFTLSAQRTATVSGGNWSRAINVTAARPWSWTADNEDVRARDRTCEGTASSECVFHCGAFFGEFLWGDIQFGAGGSLPAGLPRNDLVFSYVLDPFATP